MGGAGAAARHGGVAGVARILDLAGGDEVNVGVHAACGEDLAFARDHLGAGADDDGDAGLGVWVAGLADGVDQAVAQGYVVLVDAGVVEDQGVGDDGTDRPAAAENLGLPHAVTDHLAVAELDLIAVSGQVAFHLKDEVAIAEAGAVAGGRAVHGLIIGAS